MPGCILAPVGAYGKENIRFEAVNYNALIPMLVEAVKELDQKATENRNQEERIALLEKQIQALSRLEEKYDELNKLVNDICANGCEGFLPSENTPTGGDKLYQNTPNPFDKETRIEYYLTTASEHSFIAVYNSNGVLLQQFNNLTAGRNFITINAGALTTGTYFYSLHYNGSKIDTKTMTIIK